MKRTNKPTKKGKTLYRFYKSNLPAIVWSPFEDKPLADFSEGHFTTDDLKVAKFLLDNGYPQIPVDAKKPPNILVSIPGKSINTDEREGPLEDIRKENKEKGYRKPVIQEFVE